MYLKNVHSAGAFPIKWKHWRNVYIFAFYLPSYNTNIYCNVFVSNIQQVIVIAIFIVFAFRTRPRPNKNIFCYCPVIVCLRLSPYIYRYMYIYYCFYRYLCMYARMFVLRSTPNVKKNFFFHILIESTLK